MRNFSKLFILFFFGSVVFVACNDDETDTIKPVIMLNSPSDHAHFHPGDEIDFDANFSDDVALKQMKIDIHIGEGHDHKSGSDEVEWLWDTIVNLSGKSMHKHFHIQIPENAKDGDYHFLVYVTDEAGNESFVAIEIEIEDDDH